MIKTIQKLINLKKGEREREREREEREEKGGWFSQSLSIMDTRLWIGIGYSSRNTDPTIKIYFIVVSNTIQNKITQQSSF